MSQHKFYAYLPADSSLSENIENGGPPISLGQTGYGVQLFDFDEAWRQSAIMSAEKSGTGHVYYCEVRGKTKTITGTDPHSKWKEEGCSSIVSLSTSRPEIRANHEDVTIISRQEVNPNTWIADCSPEIEVRSCTMDFIPDRLKSNLSIRKKRVTAKGYEIYSDQVEDYGFPRMNLDQPVYYFKSMPDRESGAQMFAVTEGGSIYYNSVGIWTKYETAYNLRYNDDEYLLDDI
eukprot:NODE_6027_length_936_cov_42.605166_g5439_i0.p1 GENE.NODE_6027_length_936_cov_42.605166_g5439_i0~~NODE_6027_length_936_cov_42.605166_g5439_i0.p1  ORF type:complete len:233 (-),score=34.63 NODE_6027_length_936_cov_42.605166_g5439_i0:181-879(-)